MGNGRTPSASTSRDLAALPVTWLRVPAGAILVLPAEFEGEFTGDTGKIAAIVDARPGMTGYPALVARELGVPMVSGAPLPDRIGDGDTVTLHADRGVVFEGDVIRDGNR